MPGEFRLLRIRKPLNQRPQFACSRLVLAQFQQRVPWFEQAHRLYRIFEFLATHTRALQTSVGGRIPGKLNLNTIWDVETFLALCDPQPGNGFTEAHVRAIFEELLAQRSPMTVPGPIDHPFRSLATDLASGLDAPLQDAELDAWVGEEGRVVTAHLGAVLQTVRNVEGVFDVERVTA